MRAVRCCDKHVKLVDIPSPEGSGVRIKVRSAGICSSDLHMLDAGFPIPGTLGHEVAGITPDGRAVAIEPVAPCGHCDMCTCGDYHLCRLGAGSIVLGVGQDGGMADEMLVPERSIVPLPANVRVEDACLVEPLAVAAHGVRMLDVNPGRRVAVIGAGSVGLAATAVLAGNVGTLHVAARHDVQKAAVERLGGGLDPREEYDVVIECAGNGKAFSQAAQLCRPGGTILLLASYFDSLEFPAALVAMKELKIYSSFLYNRSNLVRDVDVAANLLASRPELPGILITHRLPLDAAPEAFDIARDRAAGAIKVVLEP